MKQNLLFKQLLVIVFALVGSVSAWGADATLTFSEQGYTNAQQVSSGTIDSYTSWSATDGTNPTAYYSTGSGLRIYNGGTFTVTSTKTIASITLTFSGTGYTFSTSNTTTLQTVTPNATSQSWDVSRTCRLQKVEVTYGSTKTSLKTMQEIFDKATDVKGTATDVSIQMGSNWVVSGVNSTGKNVYVTDGTYGFQIYGSSNLGFAVGDILTGTVDCKIQLYNGAAELTSLTSSTTGLTITKGGTVSPTVVNISDLSGINSGRVVTLNNVTYNSDGDWLSDGVNQIKIYNQLYSFSLTNGKQYNVTGVFLMYSNEPTGQKDIMPRSAADIQEVVAATYTVTWTVEGATYSTTTDVASGSKVSTLPTAPTSSCDGTFAGWVKSDNAVAGKKPGDEYKTDPTPFTDVAGSPAITGDTEFVAVFKKEL